MKHRCHICGRWSVSKLCKNHKGLYMWDSALQGYRLKKRLRGSRYTTAAYHKNEIELTRIIESYYGPSDVVTAFHPIWAKTPRKVLYEFDIYIISRNILIEYNGRQHYEFTPFFHKTKKRFYAQQDRDEIKAELARKNGFDLMIFKYDEPIFEDYVINKIEGKYDNIK